MRFEKTVLTFDDFHLDAHQLWQGERRLPLRPRAVAVLRYLVERAEQTVSEAELMAHVWQGTHVSHMVVRVCIHEIRAALGESAAEPRYVETVRGKGYRFCHPMAMGSATGIPRGREIDPLPVVGRQAQLEQLRQGLNRARQGQRQLMFVSGEVGMGKTTLVEHFLASLTEVDDVRVAHGYCLDYHGEGEPYLPFLGALEQLCNSRDGGAILTSLHETASGWLMHLPGFVSEAERQALQLQT
ncbi:hypothetical protein C2W62_05410 [Candidatus Entotheonella serta]|nr:hypothetical protein C2W62_05325 [Candidatus Entotheonella serta]PON18946.1 hypothetical protein C2W62_05410 [Candidatus Entotheonella serta]